ncbi:MAG TPA: efflux RND transporter periplasmic adaptor subunit [Myxococcota bacterium]|nr:efflux RND transporter periplasmic adaptor subunit [Myxococcota bacterium]
MKFSRRNLILLAIVAVVFLIAVMRIVNRVRTGRGKADISEKAMVIKTEKIVSADIIDQVKISGTIRPANEVDVFPKIAGRIIGIYYNVGDAVKAGDALVEIEHTQIALQKESAMAALAMAKANADAAKIDFDRAKELIDKKAITRVEFEGDQLKYDTARAEQKSAQAQADIASQQLKDARVTTLISGTITKRMCEKGSTVSLTSPIFTVQDLSTLKLVTTVDAATLTRLRKGSFAILKFDTPSITLPGIVATLSPSLDPHSRRAIVEIELPEPNRKLVTNMFVDGSLLLRKLDNVLVVSNKALITSEGKATVFSIVDGKASLVDITVGQSDGLNSQVLDGLKLGDVVAISGLDRLHDGSVVITEETAK